MTNEQAIKWLKAYIQNTPFQMEQYERAFEMAIKALSQEPAEKPMCDRNICIVNEYNGVGCDECIVNKVEQEPCDDTKCGSYNNTNTFKSCSDCKLIGTDSCYMVCGGSKSLYKPKQKSEPCDDAISREDVIHYLECHKDEIHSDVLTFVKHLPSVSTTKNIVNHGTMNITL